MCKNPESFYNFSRSLSPIVYAFQQKMHFLLEVIVLNFILKLIDDGLLCFLFTVTQCQCFHLIIKVYHHPHITLQRTDIGSYKIDGVVDLMRNACSKLTQ